MTRYVYGVIHYKDDEWRDTRIPDCAELDAETAYSWYMDDDDAATMTLVTLNQDDYWRGWFYYNDEDDGEDACPCECNTEEHLDIHWESNSGGGHYDCLRYEHVVNGRIVTTRYFKSAGMKMWDDSVDITTHHQFENRLTTNDTERTRRAYI
jgi:hypothetical protein